MTRHFLKIMLPFTLVFFVFSGLGGFLVFDSVWNSGSLVEVIGGAVLLALGLFAVYPTGAFGSMLDASSTGRI